MHQCRIFSFQPHLVCRLAQAVLSREDPMETFLKSVPDPPAPLEVIAPVRPPSVSQGQQGPSDGTFRVPCWIVQIAMPHMLARETVSQCSASRGAPCHTMHALHRLINPARQLCDVLPDLTTPPRRTCLRSGTSAAASGCWQLLASAGIAAAWASGCWRCSRKSPSWYAEALRWHPRRDGQCALLRIKRVPMWSLNSRGG